MAKIYISFAECWESNTGCRSLYETCVSRQTDLAAWLSEPTAAPKHTMFAPDKICKKAVNSVSRLAAHVLARAFDRELVILSCRFEEVRCLADPDRDPSSD